jgi:hypothetical protein
VTTDPLDISAAKADLVAAMDTTPEASWEAMLVLRSIEI